MHITNIYGYIPSKYTLEMSKQSRYLSLYSQYGSYMLYREFQKIMDAYKSFCIFTKHHVNFTATILGILNVNEILMKLM